MYLKTGEGREKERERHIDRLPVVGALTGKELTTQTCALTRNGTSDLLLFGRTPNQLSHTGQGRRSNFT